MSSIRRPEGANIDALLKAAEILEEKLYSHNHFDLRESSETGLDRCPNISQLKLNSLKNWLAICHLNDQNCRLAPGDLTNMESTVTDHVPQLRVDLANILKMTAQPGLEELQLIRDATEKLKKTSTLDPLAFSNTDLLFNGHPFVGPNPNSHDLTNHHHHNHHLHHHHRTPSTPWLRCSNRLDESAPNAHLGNFGSNTSHHHHNNRVITAASGLGHLTSSGLPGILGPSEEEPDTVSNGSEDLGLDNSSQDSFPGASSAVSSNLNLNLPLNSDMIMRQARSSQSSSSNCRLRTALLTSTCLKNSEQPQLQQQNGFNQTTDKPSVQQHPQQRQHHQHRVHSPASRTSLVVSRKSSHRSPTPTDSTKPAACLVPTTPISPDGRKSPDLQPPGQGLRKCKSFTLRTPQEFSSWSAPPSVASAHCCGTPDKELLDSSLPLMVAGGGPFTMPPELGQTRSHLPNRPGRLSCSSLPVKKRKLDWKQLQQPQQNGGGSDNQVDSAVLGGFNSSTASDLFDHHHQPCSAPPISNHSENLFKIGLAESGHDSSDVRFSIGEGRLVLNASQNATRKSDEHQRGQDDDDEEPVCRRPRSIPAPLMNGTAAFHEANNPSVPERRISYQFRPQMSLNNEFSSLMANHSSDLDAVRNSLKPCDFNYAPSPSKYQSSHSSVLARTLEASTQPPNPTTSATTEPQSLQQHQQQLDPKSIRLWIDTRPDGSSVCEGRNLSTGSLNLNSGAMLRLPNNQHHQSQPAPPPPRSPSNHHPTMTAQHHKLGTNLYRSTKEQGQPASLTKYMSLDLNNTTINHQHHHHHQVSDNRSRPFNRSLSLTTPLGSNSLAERKSGVTGLIQDRQLLESAASSTSRVVNGNDLGDAPNSKAKPTFSDLINSMITRQSLKEFGDHLTDTKLDQMVASFPNSTQSDCLNMVRKLSNSGSISGTESDRKGLANGAIADQQQRCFNDCDTTDPNASLLSKLSAVSSSAARGAQVIMMLSPSAEDPSSTKSPNSTNPSTPALLTPTTNLNYSLVQGLTMANRTTNGTSSFPLLLVSASSSASAAAMAAAAALATGAPPTSLVPVPVQVTTYVPPKQDQMSSSSTSDSQISNHVADNNNSSGSNQRFILSVLPSPNDSTASDRKIPLILSAPLFGNSGKADPNPNPQPSTPPALKCVPVPKMAPPAV